MTAPTQAQIGEADWRDAKIKTLENTAKINLAAYHAVKSATIERCAQVAEKDGWHKAADAIRKLKDEHE